MPSRVLLRPKRSVGQAPVMEPTTVPQRAEDMARPCMKLLKSHMRWMVCSAPEMTTVSNPKRKPANADVSDQARSLLREFMGEG